MKYLKILSIILSLSIISSVSFAISMKDFDVWRSPTIEHRAAFIMEKMRALEPIIKNNKYKKYGFKVAMIVILNKKTKSFNIFPGCVRFVKVVESKTKKEKTLAKVLLMTDDLKVVKDFDDLIIVDYITIDKLKEYYDYTEM
jgi:hypothetical protein